MEKTEVRPYRIIPLLTLKWLLVCDTLLTPWNPTQAYVIIPVTAGNQMDKQIKREKCVNT